MLKCITGNEGGGGGDYPIFMWRKEGQPLPPYEAKHIQLLSRGNSFLEIPRAGLRSEGNYTCTVTGGAGGGIARKTFRLCVVAPKKKEDCPGWWYNWARS
jgi:hypothetical protein